MKVPDPAKAKKYFEDKMSFTTGPVELNRAIQQREPMVIVDVRAADAYAKSHIPGAISLPKEQWESAAGLSKDKVNMIYCYSDV